MLRAQKDFEQMADYTFRFILARSLEAYVFPFIVLQFHNVHIVLTFV